jgi:hypothetical protein
MLFFFFFCLYTLRIPAVHVPSSASVGQALRLYLYFARFKLPCSSCRALASSLALLEFSSLFLVYVATAVVSCLYRVTDTVVLPVLNLGPKAIYLTSIYDHMSTTINGSMLLQHHGVELGSYGRRGDDRRVVPGVVSFTMKS